MNVAIIGRALPSLALIAAGIIVPRDRLQEHDARARRPRHPTDPHQRLRRRRRRRPGRGRGRARDGDVGAPDAWRVELPLALPLIFTGIRIATVFVVATAPIAAIAGGGGLGDIIVNQSIYGLEGSSAPRCASRCSRSGRTRCSASLQRALTPPGVGGQAHPLEPDVARASRRVRPATTSRKGGT